MADTFTACPFIAGPMLTDPNLFFGREDELRILVGKLRGRQPVSVNLVGERRIGKSSLLYHFVQTWEGRVPDPSRFAVLYLDLQKDTPATEEAFYKLLATALKGRPSVQQALPSHFAFARFPRDHREFSACMEALAAVDLLPIFCLDEFETLLHYPKQFNDHFFDRLRGLMNANLLLFILSSRRSLDLCAGEQKLTSAFFNLGHMLRLAELSEEAADHLVNLPMPEREALPALQASDQKLARQWGGRHPYLLQLAAGELFDARQCGKDTRWAEKRFLEQSCRIQAVSRWKRLLRGILRCCRRPLKSLAEDAVSLGKIIGLIVALLLSIYFFREFLASKLTSADIITLAKKLWL